MNLRIEGKVGEMLLRFNIYFSKYNDINIFIVFSTICCFRVNFVGADCNFEQSAFVC